MRSKTNTKKNRTPLSVWVVAGLYSLVFVGSFDLLAKQVRLPEMQAFENHNRRRIERFAQVAATRPNAKRIVLLGNSMTKYATNIDETTMRLGASDEFCVLRIVNNWANFSDFASLNESILALEPDLIVIQADLLGRKRVLQRLTNEAKLQNYLGWKIVGRGDWNPEKIDQVELQIDQVDFNDQSETRFARRKKSVTEWQTIDIRSPDAEMALEFVALASRCSRVALLVTPVTTRARSLQKAALAKLAPAIQDAESHGAFVLQFPGGVLDDDRFSDFVHMNAVGRAEYMSFLVKQLRMLLSQPPNAPVESSDKTTLNGISRTF